VGALLQQAILDHRDKRWMQGIARCGSWTLTVGKTVRHRPFPPQRRSPAAKRQAGRSELVSESTFRSRRIHKVLRLSSPGSAQRRSRSWLARIVATGRSGSRAGQNRSASRQRILRVLGFKPEAASGDGPGERSRQVLNADGVRLPATGLEHDANPA